MPTEHPYQKPDAPSVTTVTEPGLTPINRAASSSVRGGGTRVISPSTGIRVAMTDPYARPSVEWPAVSFGFLSYFRQGAWRDARYFLLHQRRDALARVAVINAELRRIGSVRILYARRDPEDANSPMSESRVGLDVTPGTSLEHLLQAYVAQGGNPFDVSMFLSPGAVEVVEPPGSSTPTSPTVESGASSNTDADEPEDQFRETEPYGGVAAAGSTDPLAGGLYTGGWLPLWRYPPRRMGGNNSYAAQASETARTVDAARRWASREIRTLRNDLEARVIKLMDLREQLIQERDELLPTALGGSVPGIFWDEDQFAQSYNLTAIVDLFDSVFYPRRDDGSYDFGSPRVTGPSPGYPTLLDDAPDGEEDWTGIG